MSNQEESEKRLKEERSREQEKDLSSHRLMLSRLFQFAPIGLSLSTLKEGRYLDVNQEVLRIYGISRDEMVGKTALDLGVWIDPGSRAQIVSLLESDGFVRNIEIEVRTNAGKLIPMLFSATILEVDGEMCMLAAAQDITQRRRIEDQLRLKQFTIDHARDAFYLTGPDGQFVDVNDSACQALGYERRELLDMSVYDIDPHCPQERWAERWSELKKQRSLILETIHRGKNGSTFPVEIAISYVELGQREYNCAFVRDITERKLAEHKLRTSERKYRYLYETMTQGVVIQDTEGKIIEANRAASDILGLSMDQLFGKTTYHPRWKLIHEDGSDYDPADMPSNIALRTGTAVKDALCGIYVPEQDEYRWVVIGSAPQTKEGEGTPFLTMTVFTDITERRRAGQALRESEDRYSSFVRNFKGIAYRAKMNFTPVFFHGAVEEITGYTQTDFCSGQPRWDQVIHPEDLPTLFTHDEKKLHSVSNFSYEREYRIVHKDGREIWVNDHIQNVCDASGKPVELQGVIYDITNRKKAEQEKRITDERIREAQKLESLGVLAGGIAHDFNNLLMGVLGNADMALLELNSSSPAHGYLQDIQTASIRLAELTQQMLAYSGKGKFLVKPFDLSTLVEEMIQLIKISITKKVELKLQLAHSLPSVRGDASQIRQVVMNLITNAAEACGNDMGVISVVTGLVKIGHAELLGYMHFENLTEGEYILLEVADTGCGMDKNTCQKLFEPFFSTKFAGRGLGMAAVMGIIRSHNGAIKVCSEPERGTIIKILFPYEEGQIIAAGEEPSPNRNLISPKKGRVLLVDDEDTVVSVGSAMLKRLGHDVVSAANGMEAVKIVGEQADSLVCVLLDFTMPKMDGIETYSAIRSIRADLPVVMCSGYNLQEASARFADKGLKDFLQKPYRYQELAEKLREILE